MFVKMPTCLPLVAKHIGYSCVMSCSAMLGPACCLLLCWDVWCCCSERVLMIPHPKSGQSLQDVFNNRSEWMLLDRSRISFDGSECDKVGVKQPLA